MSLYEWEWERRFSLSREKSRRTGQLAAWNRMPPFGLSPLASNLARVRDTSLRVGWRGDFTRRLLSKAAAHVYITLRCLQENDALCRSAVPSFPRANSPTLRTERCFVFMPRERERGEEGREAANKDEFGAWVAAFLVEIVCSDKAFEKKQHLGLKKDSNRYLYSEKSNHCFVRSVQIHWKGKFHKVFDRNWNRNFIKYYGASLGHFVAKLYFALLIIIGNLVDDTLAV